MIENRERQQVGWTAKDITAALIKMYKEINGEDIMYYNFGGLVGLARTRAMHRLGDEWSIRRETGPTLPSSPALVFDRKHVLEIFHELHEMAAAANVPDREPPWRFRSLRTSKVTPEVVDRARELLLEPRSEVDTPRRRRLFPRLSRRQRSNSGSATS